MPGPAPAATDPSTRGEEQGSTMSEMDVNPTDDAERDDSLPADLDVEAPEADAVEQHTDIREQRDRLVGGIPFDADEADAADQSRVVELDEDDYR